MENDFINVKAFAFDVDGVLSCDTSPLNDEGNPMRTANVKDGFAIRNAILLGFPIAIITGGNMKGVRLRHEKLGVKYIYDNVRDKIESLYDFILKTGIESERILFIEDDLVDYKIMREIGFPACPNDAVEEIRSISKYISPYNGGEGCVRDVIEKVLKSQNKWFTNDFLIQNSF